jgi:tetratricopeptide (TPR) repeat protein
VLGRFTLLLLVAGIASGAAGPQADSFPSGAVIADVRCRKDPDISYALYLPPSYSAHKAWPIIWCISPGGNGLRPVQLLQPAAERFGYILVGANSITNGPWQPIDHALRVMVKDVEQRLSIDEKRHYGIGFSGGARIILDLAIQKRSRFSGVILCGAVYSSRRQLPRSGRLMIITLVGDSDLAMFEHMQAEEQLAGRYLQWHEVFAGPHRWPPGDLLEEAVELLEATAMLRDDIPRESELLALAVQARVHRAEQQLSAGQPLAALRTFRQTGSVLAGVAGADHAARRARALQQEPAVVQLQAEEKRFISELEPIALATGDKGYEQALLALQTRMAGSGPYAERARHALHLAVLYLAQRAAEMVRSGELDEARDMYIAARIIFPDYPIPAYNAACLFARAGDTESAIKLLRDAAAHRFDNLELLRTDPDLETLRGLPELAEIERDVQQNQEQGIAPPLPPWVEADQRP